jgi:hypothetical protein
MASKIERRGPRVHSHGGPRLLRSVAIILAACAFFVMGSTIYAQTRNPVPHIANPLVPTYIAPGAGNTTLTVNGTGFISTSVVNWTTPSGTTPLTTKFVSGNQLTATIPAADLASAGSGVITVTNPQTSGISSTSNIGFFEVATTVSALNFNQTNTATVGNPTGVAIASFRNNGLLDLAISNDTVNEVEVFLGNGDGTFQAGVTYPTGDFPYNVFAADFNNDGCLDLVTVDQRANGVSVLLGVKNSNGTCAGTFGHPINTAVGSGASPSAMYIADFNGDGNMDVVTANNGTGINTVSVLLGKGTGGFAAAVQYPTGRGPIDVTVGDFNGDGVPDLAVANNIDSTVSVLLGNCVTNCNSPGNGIGNGTFGPQVPYTTVTFYGDENELTAGLNPNGITTAAFNGSGILDIATSDADDFVTVLTGSGNGTFDVATGLPVNYGAGNFPAFSVGAADFYDDGLLDLTTPEYVDGDMSILKGVESGGSLTFSAYIPYPALGALTNPDAFGVADFNNDGRLDIVAMNESANMFSLLAQYVPDVTFTPATFSFGLVNVGTSSATKKSTVTNTGTVAVNDIVVTITGTNASEFSQTNTCTTTLNPGATCTVSVVMSPITGGTKSAMVTLTDSEGTQNLILGGTGVQQITISPTDMETFKPQLVNTTSAPYVATLTNVSLEPLYIYSISITGADVINFPETAPTCPISPPDTLAAGASCTINISFAPSSPAGFSASGIIMSSSSTPKRGITLKGDGTAVELTPTSLAFGTVDVGDSSQMTVTLTNAWTTSLTVTSVAISGTGATSYSQTNTCTANPVLAGGSCAVTVTFAPTKTGPLPGTLTFTDTDYTVTQTVSMTGTGAN